MKEMWHLTQIIVLPITVGDMADIPYKIFLLAKYTDINVYFTAVYGNY